ncbi:MAG: carbon-nitrogen family hydrolase [Actinomycetota bacterium]
MKVAAVQHDIVWEEPKANFSHLEPLVAAAAGQGARLVVLTEMFATGFSMAAERIAESRVGGPSAEFLATCAAEHDVWMCGSIPERRDGGRPCNQLVLVAPDGAAHRYAKIHPFSYAGEHEHYEAGTTTLTVDVEGVLVSPFVCYDLRFPEEPRSVAGETDLYVVVANWPAARRRHWQVLLQARAIENQAYVVGVNRVGSGDGLDYAGDSMIIDPMGDVLASAAGGEAVLVADVDPAVVREVRASLPFLADRRK